MTNEKLLPAYIDESLRKICVALVNLWTWSNVVERSDCEPQKWCVFYVYNRDLAQGGVQGLDCYRWKITIEMESPQDIERNY